MLGAARFFYNQQPQHKKGTNMTSPYEMFGTKEISLSDKPTEFDYGDFKIYAKYGGPNNRSFINAFNVKMRKYERRDKLAEDGKLNDEAIKKLEDQKRRDMAELYADHIITGWKGVKDENGKTMSFNRDNVIKLLTDLDALFADIMEQAAKDANFAKEQEEVESKNSGKS